MTYDQKYRYYNTKRCNGYDSKFEAGYAQELELRKKAKESTPISINHLALVISHNHYLKNGKISA